MTSSTVPPVEVYRSMMEEAKLRLLAVERAVDARTPITGMTSLDAEFCFLQLRKVVELIAFSAMKREEGRYRRLRELHREGGRDHGDASRDWQAQDILKRLVALSPHALPIPFLKVEESGEGAFHLARKAMTVNHGRLIDLYTQCGGFMHAKNALGPDFATQVEKERTKYAAAPDQIRKAQTFLKNMLWQHVVVQLEWSDPDNPTEVSGPAAAWIVDFGTDPAQHVTVLIGEASSP